MRAKFAQGASESLISYPTTSGKLPRLNSKSTMGMESRNLDVYLSVPIDRNSGTLFNNSSKMSEGP